MNKKRWHALVIALCTASTLHGQSVGINATGANPEASSILDISSTTKGFLAPRMTASQRLAILSPAMGLTVFQTDGESGYWVYDTVWKPISQPDLSSYATLSGLADSTAQIRSVIPSAANFATKEAVDAHTAAIAINTAKVGITPAQASAITVNTAKVGITVDQASAITANTAKVGITVDQASAITANTAKVGITTTQADAITANTAKVGITTDQANAITTNTAKVGITNDQANAITTNTAKVGITTAQADAITANTAKVGITTAQASAITANTAKVGITTVQADAITTNTAGLALKAPIASPVFTGTVTAPTLVAGSLSYPTSDGTSGQVLTTDGSGALNWGTAGLTNFTESSYEFDGIAGTKLVATNDSANVDLVIEPKGTGAIIAQQPDGTTTGGNKRGAKSVDLQTIRNDATQVASGQNSTISGGEGNTASGLYATISGGGANTASHNLSVVSGGMHNIASELLATVSGGEENTASGRRSTASGGGSNTASGENATVSGGSANTASGRMSTVSGGGSNTASGENASVSGGSANTASGYYSFAAGLYNFAKSYGETVLGFYATDVAGNSTTSVPTDRLFVIGNGTFGASSNALTLLKNGNMTIAGALTTGAVTYPSAYGTGNQLLKMNAGGTALEWGTAGGLTNFTESNYVYSGKTGTKLIATNAATDVDFVIQPKGTGAILAQQPDGTIAGGNKRGAKAVDLQTLRDSVTQVASGYSSTVSGGVENTASYNYSTVSGGTQNTSSGLSSTVSGGTLNTASGHYATISGGWANTASLNSSVVSGGQSNTASKERSTVSGGQYNTSSGEASTVSGGQYNIASGEASTVSGGQSNTASGLHSFAAGLSNGAKSYGETVLGFYATDIAGNLTTRVDGDRLFVIGNGTAVGARSNALTLLKNGNMTIAGALTTGAVTYPIAYGTGNQLLKMNAGGTALEWGTAGCLTNFTESNYLYSGKTGTKLVATNAAADADFVIQPKGTGAILAQQPDGTDVGGDNRGMWAIDLQQRRNNSTQVASGTSAAISGGGWNTASGFGSVVSGGVGHIASGEYSVVSGGQHDTASGSHSTVAGGASNNASGIYSTVVGGASNNASGKLSFAAGLANTARSYSEVVMGYFSTVYTPNSTTEHDVSDRLFVIGNGTGHFTRSNALTLLKNGNMTIAGALTAGTVTYPNTNGTNGYVLTTNGAGTASWTAPASPAIADGSITSAKILDGTVATADIASNAVDGTKVNLTGNAAGDLMYYNGTDWTRIPAGTSGKVLQSNGTNAPTWETPAGGTSSSIVHNGVLSGTTAQEDNFDATGGNQVCQQTIVSTGLYIVNAEIRVAANTSISAHLLNNGVEIRSAQGVSTTNDVAIATISQVVTIVAGDVLNIRVSQYGGSGATVTGRIVITKLP